MRPQTPASFARGLSEPLSKTAPTWCRQRRPRDIPAKTEPRSESQISNLGTSEIHVFFLIEKKSILNVTILSGGISDCCGP